MRSLLFTMAFMIPLAGLSGAAAAAASGPLTIHLKAQNRSGENGTATLVPEGTRTKVIIRLAHAPAGIVQPAHIHPGTCIHLNPHPKWLLANVVNGKSETIVPVPLSTIQNGTYAINVHKSKKQMGISVSCGNIPGMHTMRKASKEGY